jgi:hypothetical protein
MLISITKILLLRRIILFSSLILLNIKFKNFYQEVDCVSLMELLLNTDCYIYVCFFTTLNRDVEILVWEEGIMWIRNTVSKLTVPITFGGKFIGWLNTFTLV